MKWGNRWAMAAAAVAIGLCVVAFGFAYDLAFAGLPYQDPTPEIQLSWQYHSRIAKVITLSGIGLTFVGMAALAIVGVCQLVARRAQSVHPD